MEVTAGGADNCMVIYTQSGPIPGPHAWARTQQMPTTPGHIYAPCIDKLSGLRPQIHYHWLALVYIELFMGGGAGIHVKVHHMDRAAVT